MIPCGVPLTFGFLLVSAHLLAKYDSSAILVIMSYMNDKNLAEAYYRSMKANTDVIAPELDVFAAMYAATFNLHVACDAAGLDRRRATSIIANPAVMQRIADYSKSVVKDATTTAQGVLDELAAMNAGKYSEILNSDGGYKPLDQWPEHWQDRIESVETYPNGIPYKVKLTKKTTLLDMIGKHVNVKAWQENINVNVTMEEQLRDELTAAQNRVKDVTPGKMIEHDEQ